MFVLPPPPRYPAQQYSANSLYGPQGGPPIVIETNNILSHPTGAESMFFVGEGQYILREDILLATPPPHPSEIPVLNPNPLATSSNPPTAGTKISTIVIKNKEPSSSYRNSQFGINGSSSENESSEHIHDRGSEPRTSTSTDTGSDMSKNGGETAPVAVQSTTNGAAGDKFGSGNTSLANATKDGAKRRKPKNSLAKSNSSFISRIITHEALAKRLSEHASDDLFVFANVNRAFNWLDLSASTNKQEALSKILFTKAHPLCHDVNELTKSAAHIDVIIGFSSGDIVWFDPMSNKYSRLNKNKSINSSAVLDICWLPESENLFLAAHADGSLICYDKEKEDAPFIPDGAKDDSEMHPPTTPEEFLTQKSVYSIHQKSNPVSYWSVSKHALNAMSLSPDGKHLAVVSEDGTLRIINIMKEKLLDVYQSYYGGLLCVCWSPDGRYVVTGGQDDLVSIWSFAERRIVARCNGHHSWVTSVAFDPWRCDQRTYRFGSVGEDCRLLLWDFSVGMLTRPKAASTTHRGSISSAGVGRARAESQSGGRLRSESIVSQRNDDVDINHPVEIRARTSNLPPIMSKVVDPDPLSMLEFREDSIITTCKEGHIRTWDRPKKANSGNDGALAPVPET